MAPTLDSARSPRASFTYLLAPHHSIIDSVSLRNRSSHAISVELYPVPALTSNTGSLVLGDRTSAKKDASSWIRLTESTVTIPASSTKEVTFEVDTPARIEPGDHATGIIAELPPRLSSGADSSMKLSIVQRYGLFVFIHTPGHVVKHLTTSMKTHVLDHRLRSYIQIVNDGNTTRRLTMITEYSHLVTSSEHYAPTVVSVLPHQTANLTVESSRHYDLLGHATARISIMVDQKTSILCKSVWWFEWRQIGLILLLVGCLLIIGLIASFVRKYRNI